MQVKNLGKYKKIRTGVGIAKELPVATSSRKGDSKMEKVYVNGVAMWKECNGEIRINPDEKLDLFGAKKVDVDGKVMWQLPNGQRVESTGGYRKIGRSQ